MTGMGWNSSSDWAWTLDLDPFGPLGKTTGVNLIEQRKAPPSNLVRFYYVKRKLKR